MSVVVDVDDGFLCCEMVFVPVVGDADDVDARFAGDIGLLNEVEFGSKNSDFRSC